MEAYRETSKNGWKRSQTSSGFYRKKEGKLPEFLLFERTDYKNNKYLVLYKKGLGRERIPLKYFKTKYQALVYANKLMRSKKLKGVI